MHSCSRKTLFLCLVVVELIDGKKCHKKMLHLTLQSICNVYLIADPCYNCQNLSDYNRKSSYATPHGFGPAFCDDWLHERCYLFAGAAGTSQLFQSRQLSKLKYSWWYIRSKYLIREAQKIRNFSLYMTIKVITGLRVRPFSKSDKHYKVQVYIWFLRYWRM